MSLFAPVWSGVNQLRAKTCASKYRDTSSLIFTAVVKIVLSFSLGDLVALNEVPCCLVPNSEFSVGKTVISW